MVRAFADKYPDVGDHNTSHAYKDNNRASDGQWLQIYGLIVLPVNIDGMRIGHQDRREGPIECQRPLGAEPQCNGLISSYCKRRCYREQENSGAASTKHGSHGNPPMLKAPGGRLAGSARIARYQPGLSGAEITAVCLKVGTALSDIPRLLASRWRGAFASHSNRPLS